MLVEEMGSGSTLVWWCTRKCCGRVASKRNSDWTEVSQFIVVVRKVEPGKTVGVRTDSIEV